MQWVQEINSLETIVTSHSKAAYAALTHDILHKWSFLTRTTPKVSDILKPLEDAIRLCLLPSITGKSSISNLDREIFTLLDLEALASQIHQGPRMQSMRPPRRSWDSLSTWFTLSVGSTLLTSLNINVGKRILWGKRKMRLNWQCPSKWVSILHQLNRDCSSINCLIWSFTCF